SRHDNSSKITSFGAGYFLLHVFVLVSGCAPRVTEMSPQSGTPGTLVSLSMKYLVGWPRVELGGKQWTGPNLNFSLPIPPEKRFLERNSSGSKTRYSSSRFQTSHRRTIR